LLREIFRFVKKLENVVSLRNCVIWGFRIYILGFFKLPT